MYSLFCLFDIRYVIGYVIDPALFILIEESSLRMIKMSVKRDLDNAGYTMPAHFNNDEKCDGTKI